MDQQRKHTPGPWMVVGGQVDSGNGATVCDPSAGRNWVRDNKLLPIDEREANARLIAAAPALLAALEAEDEWRGREDAGELDPEWDYERMVGYKRREAIAKAEGR